jgi:hypothetical protein
LLISYSDFFSVDGQMNVNLVQVPPV